MLKICLNVDNCKQSPSSVQEGKRTELTGVEFVGNNAQVKSEEGVQFGPFYECAGHCEPVTDQNHQ